MWNQSVELSCLRAEKQRRETDLASLREEKKKIDNLLVQEQKRRESMVVQELQKRESSQAQEQQKKEKELLSLKKKIEAEVARIRTEKATVERHLLDARQKRNTDLAKEKQTRDRLLSEARQRAERDLARERSHRETMLTQERKRKAYEISILHQRLNQKDVKQNEMVQSLSRLLTERVEREKAIARHPGQTPDPEGTGRHQHICAMDPFKNRSFEEIRWEDYQNGRGGRKGGGMGPTVLLPVSPTTPGNASNPETPSPFSEALQNFWKLFTFTPPTRNANASPTTITQPPPREPLRHRVCWDTPPPLFSAAAPDDQKMGGQRAAASRESRKTSEQVQVPKTETGEGWVDIPKSLLRPSLSGLPPTREEPKEEKDVSEEEEEAKEREGYPEGLHLESISCVEEVETEFRRSVSCLCFGQERRQAQREYFLLAAAYESPLASPKIVVYRVYRSEMEKPALERQRESNDGSDTGETEQEGGEDSFPSPKRLNPESMLAIHSPLGIFLYENSEEGN
uniref:Uncharacterized protein n=1 Tax=Chromera velia CCMP2878 TaxID=1169474 RepID=A0A0G4H531_9ALVE|eukprot:Cvel_5695.t1-p1 / transcript=Cvel_5695.t1 / gene=Cvel_5695 / organism=Chromera_velia_CCMP2878 / gene_product=hypothetical protein / transcript_product=hypothetical protein / location=Cvel_scaffold269:54508-56504(+) / protein_length=512 / sequence_SO=supercontig / SO=protein_coding / is_pseudo=false